MGVVAAMPSIGGIVLRMVIMVVAVRVIMRMGTRIIMSRVIRWLVTLRLGPVHRMPGVTASLARDRRKRRQAGNRQHQHPAQQSMEDPFHVGQTSCRGASRPDNRPTRYHNQQPL